MLKLRQVKSQMWWPVLLVLATGRPRQEDQLRPGVETRLGNIGRPPLKNKIKTDSRGPVGRNWPSSSRQIKPGSSQVVGHIRTGKPKAGVIFMGMLWGSV